MVDSKRIAVLGLYRSGSTAVAGAFHHLGADMGAPFFGGYFESAWLSEQLRRWWNEPRLEERSSRTERVRVLARWVKEREQAGATLVGMKHPLLSLCGEDLLAAWGEKTHFIWCHRPFEESLASLRSVGWSGENSDLLQRTLWTELQRFFAARDHLQIQFSDLMADPGGEISRLVAALDIHPSDDQIAAAVRFIEPGRKAKVERELQAEHSPVVKQSRMTGFIKKLRRGVMEFERKSPARDS